MFEISFEASSIILGLLSLYCLLSAFFRLNPTLIHAPRNAARNHKLNKIPISCLHISHRGGAGEHLENTMRAFDYAAALGTDMFELDCQMTMDKQVVVAHDNYLHRLCGENVLISETNFQDLPPLLNSQRLDFNKGFRLTKYVSEDERKIVLLEELFQRHPKMPMNIDIKVNNKELIKATEQLIVKYNRESFTVWGNSSHTTTKNIRSANDLIAACFSLKEILVTMGLYYTGLLPFVPIRAEFFEIPMCSVFIDHFETFPERAGTPIQRLGMRILDYLLLNKKLITHLKKRNIQTFIFVLNEEYEWRRAVDCGASGIMTDFPTNLKHWLLQHNIRAN